MDRPKRRATLPDLAQTERMLAELDEIDSKIAKVVNGGPVNLGDTMRREAMQLMNESMVLPARGHVELKAAHDEMSVTVAFYPPSGDAPLLELDEARDMLAANNISVEVDWEAVQDALFACNTERRPVTDVLVAKGRMPIDAVTEHIVLEEGVALPVQSVAGTRDRVDYRLASPFILVKQGQAVARIVPASEGSLGITVRGKTISYHTITPPSLTLGHNLIQDGAAIRAGCDGRLSLAGHTISVSPVLSIPHDVDFRSGNVNFPGDVVIQGDVKTGFKVQTSGSLLCLQTVEAATVYCEKDLVVKRGIIGKEGSSVRSGGAVHAKFVENTFLEARGSVRVEVGILNSIVQTLGRVEMGPRGIIVGGKITAGNGVVAAQLGAARGPRTELYCGIDYSVEQKMEWLREKSMLLAAKLKQVAQDISAGREPRGELARLQAKLKEALHKVNEAASQLIFQLDRDETAGVQVVGTTFPGTYIEICHRPFVVSRPLVRSHFRLDKVKGKIVVEGWRARA